MPYGASLMINLSDLLLCISFSTTRIFSGSKLDTIPLSLVGIERPLVLSLYVKSEVVSRLLSLELTRRQVRS